MKGVCYHSRCDWNWNEDAETIAHFRRFARIHEALAPEPRALADEALALYRVPFLPDESDQPSFLATREQLRARLLRCLARVARGCEDAGQLEVAADIYLRLIDADPFFEAPYRNLMLAYQRAGELAEARGVYERLRATLAAKSKTMPSPETQAVYTGLNAR